MAKEASSHSVQGNWRGHYYYADHPGEAHGFEAVFADMNGIVEGNILDDDGAGEAVVGGSFLYPDLQFTKTYRNQPDSIKYFGVMSEDGKELMGNWTIKGLLDGTWRATRDTDSSELKFEEFVQKEAEKELVRVRPRIKRAPEQERQL